MFPVRMGALVVWPLLVQALVSCSSEPVADPIPIPLPDIAPLLDASFDDPLLLTFAATRSRAEYLVDEGYTLAGDDELAFVTDTAGTLGLAFELSDAVLIGPADYASEPTIHFTSSDAVWLTFDLSPQLSVDLRFAAATSRVAVIDGWFDNRSDETQNVAAIPWLRRCDGGFFHVESSSDGVVADHDVEISEEEALFAPGTFVDEAADGLFAEAGPVSWNWFESCGAGIADDLAGATTGSGEIGSAAGFALRSDVEVPAKAAARFRFARALVPEESASDLEATAADALSLDLVDLLESGAHRLQGHPSVPDADDSDALLMHSSFALLDQLMMPAEGNLDHEYYVFSREPTWWFARLGQHAHESLSMLTLARHDCDLAMESHRVFLDRVEGDGYLPYNVGPVVETTTLGTTTAPFLSYVAWEIYQVCGDATFLQEAYTAGSLFHDFWVQQRDRDGDGLAEFGGFAVSEATRDLNNVVWEEVAAPDQVEAVDLNSWLVKDAATLAEMAGELGLPDEADLWLAAAASRAALINECMWDDDTGFYYHVDHIDNDFDFAEPSDLKRMEIAGLMPLWAGIVPADRANILLQHLTDPDRFWRAFGVPSLAADDPSYDPHASSCCRWNGPVWVQWQFLILRALTGSGEDELARELADRVRVSVVTKLADHHQFRELYDPDDVTAPNDSMPNYVWTAMVAQLMWETRGIAE